MQGKKQTTLKKRLLVGFGIVIFLFSAVSILVFSTVQQTQKLLATLQDDLFDIKTLAVMAEDMDANVRNFVNSDKLEYLEAYDRLLDASKRSTVSLSLRLPGRLGLEMGDIGNMIDSYDARRKDVLKRRSEGLTSIYLDRMMQELKRLSGYIVAECTRVLSQYMTITDDTMEGMREELAARETASYAVLALCAAASVMLGLHVTKDVSRPIRALALELASFAEGKLETPELEKGGIEEIGLLVESYRDMTSRIRGLVEDIRVASEFESELRRQEIRSLRMENSIKQSELETLQARINPHFLFNTLNTISALAEIEDAARTRSAVNSMAILLRAQMDASRAVVRLDRELESVEHYLLLQEVRFGKRLRHEIRTGQGTEDFLVPGMIIQPFVENAVIHGIEPLERGGTVTVETSLEGAGLRISIVDNGTGFDPLAQDGGLSPGPQKGSHEGMSNVSRRIELLYGVKGIAIDSAPGMGTRIAIRLPHPCPVPFIDPLPEDSQSGS